MRESLVSRALRPFVATVPAPKSTPLAKLESMPYYFFAGVVDPRGGVGPFDRKHTAQPMSRNANDGEDDDKGAGGGTPKTGVVVKTRLKTKKPDMYKVLMLNDDYTPMEFVVYVLERFFNKGHRARPRGSCSMYTIGALGFAASSPMRWRKPR